jgi:hypothetical protein
MFTVGGLYAEGEEFAKKMIEDNDAGRKGSVSTVGACVCEGGR